MPFKLKPISIAAIPVALQRAERYRLLNEPALAESICLDVLEVDPENQRAIVMLLLSITDQFGHGASMGKARELLPQLKGEYEQRYFAGLIWERSAHAQLRSGVTPGVYNSLTQAMQCYEDAIELRIPGNDDSILRWNTCARILMRNPSLRPKSEEAFQPVRSE
jgi:hypothetical protein